jgi:hypothetical protein
MRDELGLDNGMLARPFQAALVSAASFATLAALLLALVVAPASLRVPAITVVSLVSLEAT